MQVTKIRLFILGEEEDTVIYQRLEQADIPQLLSLMQKYKSSIGEVDLSETQFDKLITAITQGRIDFFVAKHDKKLVAMCSVSVVFSTFLCENGGIFEDFYIAEDYRGKGVARSLTQYVFEEMKSRGVVSVWVGCADADVEMYKSLGFNIPLGNLLTWSSDE